MIKLNKKEKLKNITIKTNYRYQKSKERRYK